MQEHRHPHHDEVLTDAMVHRLELVILNQETIMSTIQDILEAVQKEQGVVASVAALVTQLAAQVKQLTAGALPPDVQAEVDQAFQIATANASTLAQALASNASQPAPTAIIPPPAPAPTPPAAPVAPALPASASLTPPPATQGVVTAASTT